MTTYHDFIHPEDRKARQQLEAIPGFRALAKTIMRVYDERVQHGLNMATKVRLGPQQLPRYYSHLPQACAALGIAEPEFYLEMNPAPNAYTYGDTRIFVTVTSGLLEYLDEDEVRAVVAHECGHIACRHTLYSTMARYLIQYGLGALGLAGKAFYPAILALLYWYRRSEFSADRAAAVASGGPEAVVETMLRLAGGPKSITGEVDLELYAQQADAYQEIKDGSWWDNLLQSMQVMQMSHPLAAVRVREIRAWCAQERFRRLRDETVLRALGHDCARCKQPVAPDWAYCRACGAPVQTTTQGALEHDDSVV